jgi:hypothetical protein
VKGEVWLKKIMKPEKTLDSTDIVIALGKAWKRRNRR